MAIPFTDSPSIADPLAAHCARWRAQVDAELKGVPFEKKLVTRTPEGIAIQPLYTRLDLAEVPHLARVPGELPLLRGVRAEGYRTHRWEIAQEIGATRAHAFNEALLHDLMQGQDSVVITPDAATRAGLDPDEAPAGAVGGDGLSLIDVEDMATALRKVDLQSVPLHLAAGADAAPVAALLVACLRAQDIPTQKLTGSLTADPFAASLERGTSGTSWAIHYDSLAAWTRWAATHAPRLRTIGVDTTAWNSAGASAVQELAFALSTATEYLRGLAACDVGLSVAASRIRFSFGIGPVFFTEVAKFRAFRLIWARALAAAGVPQAAAEVAVHARTGRWNKTLLDPHVNMLRVTTESLSAVMGGVDSLHIAPFDEVTGATTEFSRRIARNLHTLLAEEFMLTATTDPAGGSWYVEKLTDQLAREAWKLFQSLEAAGGWAAAIEAGLPQAAVGKIAGDKASALASRRVSLIGTNLFPNPKDKLPLPAGRELGALQVARGRAARERRGGNCPPKGVARGDWNARFNAALAGARDGLTIGQLARLMHEGAAEGGGRSIKRISTERAAEPFEALRRASEAFAVKQGNRPRVFVAKMGPVLQHKARADFTAGFFAVGGFELIARQTFDNAEAAAEAALASGAGIAVLCSTDDTYPELAPAFATAIKAAKPELAVVLAGLPGEAALVDRYRSAGVDEFIHLRSNVHAVLTTFLTMLGAL